MFGEHAIISSELNFASQKIKIIHFPFSDHDGVIMTLKVSEPERGQLYRYSNRFI
jgi:hypothetical protein